MKTHFLLPILAATLLIGCEKDAPPPPPVTQTPAATPPPAGEPTANTLVEAPRDPTPMEQSQAAYLTLQVQEFAAKNGRVPTDLSELVAAKMLPKIPPAPRGFRYEIDPKNRQVLLRH